MDTKTFEQIKGMSAVTMQLVQLLRNAESETIDDLELKRCAGFGCAPGERGYSSLQSAVRYCEREYGICWERVRKGGEIRRLDNPSKIQRGYRERQGICRKSKRATRVLASVTVSELTDAQRCQHHALAAQMGAIAMFSATSTTKALANSNKAALPLQLEETLKMFQS
jgi:hypothetical protein